MPQKLSPSFIVAAKAMLGACQKTGSLMSLPLISTNCLIVAPGPARDNITFVTPNSKQKF